MTDCLTLCRSDSSSLSTLTLNKAMLWGWIDTASSNYPCLPPFDGSPQLCLEWEHLEVLFSAVDRFGPTLADIMWNAVSTLQIQR